MARTPPAISLSKKSLNFRGQRQLYSPLTQTAADQQHVAAADIELDYR